MPLIAELVSTVRFGTLDVPKGASRPLEAALRYLARDRRMRDVIERAERARSPLHLRLNGRDDDSYEPWDRVVNWDPHSALATTSGGRQSPALGLGHELAHAVEAPSLRDRYSAQAVPAYDDAEERRVIRGVESHAARTLGEGVRSDHDGTTYFVASPVAR